MIVTICDNTSTKNFLFMDNSREEKLSDFLESGYKLAKNKVIVVNGSKSNDTFFVDNINPVETNIFMKLREVKNA